MKPNIDVGADMLLHTAGQQAGSRDDISEGPDLYFGIVNSALLHDLGCPEFISSMQDINLASKLREEVCLCRHPHFTEQIADLWMCLHLAFPMTGSAFSSENQVANEHYKP